jgi:hypothetical protein
MFEAGNNKSGGYLFNSVNDLLELNKKVQEAFPPGTLDEEYDEDHPVMKWVSTYTLLFLII